MKSAVVKSITDIQHVLLRKSMYIGNCKTLMEPRWSIELNSNLNYKDTPYNEGYFKLINEIIDNSIDEYIKTGGKFSTKIDVSISQDLIISVKDNGRGVPSDIDPTTKKTQVELAFCELKSGSNWDRTASIGMNGLGSSLTNFLSESFEVKSCDGIKMTHLKSINNVSKVVVKQTAQKRNRGTEVSFKLDQSQFEGMDVVTYDVISDSIVKRLVELRGIYPKITFSMNGERITNTIAELLRKKYANFYEYTKSDNIQIGIYDTEGDGNLSQLSYLNGIDTYRGGSHIKYIQKEIFNELKERIYKKHKIEIKSNNFFNRFLLFVSFKNFNKPEFNNQNKTELINSEGDVKKYLADEPSFQISSIARGIYLKFETIIDSIAEDLKASTINKKIKNMDKDTKKIKQILSFTDAVDKNRKDTVLFIVEGESAKSHFPIVRNKMKHGLFQLRGVIINAYNNPIAKVLDNEVLIDLMKIIGVKPGGTSDNKYFEKIAISTDADVDGDHIAIMLLLFFYKFAPYMLRQGRIIKVLSPIIICKKGKQIKRFYEYEDYLKNQDQYKDWTIEYNKGLGALTEEEYSLMINDMKFHTFDIDDIKSTDEVIDVLFNKKKSDLRKTWLQGEDIYNLI